MSEIKPVDPNKYPEWLAKRLFWITMITTGIFFAASYFYVFLKGS